ncbi:flagellar export protein FliJ [Clostridium fermenticellae]|uniref:Flagellar FliJ protein n=1 Tax=Clostridium fermenticellae TaxID=2068654 RepID=A0A386H4P8_9CLOT|nr:flagellar export protein FliJ [Clostridium fermenticellae]AYD40682.1 flagellar export protein FliJ [Clostridium fermenticellae]
MKGYKFKLQKLLDIRLDMEEQSKRTFKEAQLEKLEVQNRLNSLKESYEKYRKLDNSETSVDMKIKHLYLNNITYMINSTNEVLAEKEKNLNEKRKDLKKRQVERKTVEVLKEKKQAAFDLKQKIIEQNMNDEFALYGYIRNLERR